MTADPEILSIRDRCVLVVATGTIAISGAPRPFAVLVSTDELRHLPGDWVRQFLDAGCTQFCVTGAGCEEVHDAIDDIVMEHEPVILTTWHHDLGAACDDFVETLGLFQYELLVAIAGRADPMRERLRAVVRGLHRGRS